MEPDAISDLALRLNDGQTPRVWSLLVTVFGDLAQDANTRISGKVLGQMMDIIGIKPEAMRVALHRLRKDGWIDSERRGRTSHYFLTELGRTQSAAASPRIYGTAPDASQAWLVIRNPGYNTGQPGKHMFKDAVWVTSNTAITGQAPTGADVFATPLDPATCLPDWMRSKLCDADVLAQSQFLADQLAQLQLSRQRLTPLETAALRVLVVHGWRRIVLKSPKLPDYVLPDAWAGAICRQRVAEILAALPKHVIADLDAA